MTEPDGPGGLAGFDVSEEALAVVEQRSVQLFDCFAFCLDLRKKASRCHRYQAKAQTNFRSNTRELAGDQEVGETIAGVLGKLTVTLEKRIESLVAHES